MKTIEAKTAGERPADALTDNVAHLPAVHAPAARLVPAANIFSDPVMFEHYQRVAKLFATSDLVPPHMRNVANCLIALDIGNRLNEQPLTVMQNVYVVSGRPGWKTEYVIARANRSGVFKGRITWKVEGKNDALSVTAQATLADTGEVVEATCDMAMAKAEQWTRNSKYTSMPEHMLKWRSAAFLIRLYAPEVMLGIPVIEEVETLPEVMRDITPRLTQGMKDALDSFAGSKPAAGNELDEFADDAAADQKPAEQERAADLEKAAEHEKAKAAEEAEAKAAAAKKAAADERKAGAAKKDAEAAAKAKEAEAARAQAGDLDEPGEKAAPKETAVELKTPEQYIAMLKAHVDAATDPAVLKSWFLGDAQKKLRGACGVTGASMDEAKNYTLAKIGSLPKKEG